LAFNLSEEDLDKREDMFNKVDINIYSTVIEYVIFEIEKNWKLFVKAVPTKTKSRA